MALSETFVKDWLALNSGELFPDEILEDDISDAIHYLDGNGDYSPISGLESLAHVSRAGLANFGHWILEFQEVRPSSLDIAQRIAYLTQLGRSIRFHSNRNHLTPSLPRYGETLLQLIATGRDDLLGPTEEIALGALKSGRYAPREGSVGYFVRPSKIGVFALEALAAARGEAIDWESFHVPPDRFWLDCARIGLTEEDPDRAAEWARKLCDAHLQTLQNDPESGSFSPATGHEIEEFTHFLWPIATLAFLRLRERMGLETAPFEHPLMETAFRVLHDWTVPAGAWPGTPWWTEILDKTAAVAPELSPQLKLIR